MIVLVSLTSEYISLDFGRLGPDMRAFASNAKWAWTAFVDSGLSLLLTGFVLGCVTGGSWSGRQTRRRPLLLIDPNQPDMSLLQAVAHINRRAVTSDAGAAHGLGQLSEAVVSGQLPMWLLRPPKLARRLTRREAVRMWASCPAAAAVGADSIMSPVVFRRIDVVRLWPNGITLDATPRRAPR